MTDTQNTQQQTFDWYKSFKQAPAGIRPKKVTITLDTSREDFERSWHMQVASILVRLGCDLAQAQTIPFYLDHPFSGNEVGHLVISKEAAA